MIGIRLGMMGSLGSGQSWESYWKDNTSFYATGRSGLKMTDYHGNDADIYTEALQLDGTKEYYKYEDANALDIADTNFTIGWYGQVYQEAVTHSAIFGKCVLSAAAPQGRYGFYYDNADHVIKFFFQTTETTYAIATNIVVGVNVHLFGEIDNINKKARIFINGEQHGIDIDFLGTFPSPSKPIMIGVGQRHDNTTAYSGSKCIHGYACIYKKLLTPTEKSNIMSGLYVSGAALFWIINNVRVVYDVSGNNYHANVTTWGGVAGGGRVTKWLQYPYTLNYGYTYVKMKVEPLMMLYDYRVPTINGTPIVNPLLFSTDFYVAENQEGSSNSINNLRDKIKFPAGIMDRSDTTIFNDACRAELDYDAANPTMWWIINLTYDKYKSFINEGYNHFFALWDSSAVEGSFLLQQMYWLTTPVEDISNIEKHLNIYNKTKYELRDTYVITGENCMYYYNNKTYRVYAKNRANNYDKYIFTIDSNLKKSDEYLCANLCEAEADDHSHPTVIIDADGYIYVVHEQMAGGITHGSNYLVFKSNVEGGDITAGFTLIQTLSGVYSYPTLHKVGTDIFLITRESSAGEETAILKLNIISDQFELIGNLFDTGSKHYKSPLINAAEDRLAIIGFTINDGVCPITYYAESTDGINWTNAEGTVSVDISNLEIIDDVNKSSFAIHEASGIYNSVVSDCGIMINGVPYVVMYEGHTDITPDRDITVDNVYVCRFINGAWQKILFPYTTPFAWSQKGSMYHYITKIGDYYYLLYIDITYGDYDISQMYLYRSLDLINWTSRMVLESNVNYSFSRAWFSHNMQFNNQIAVIRISRRDYYYTLSFVEELIFKLYW